MMVSSKKSKRNLVIKTILFFVAFIVLVFGSMFVYMMFSKNKYEEAYKMQQAASGQAVSGEPVAGEKTEGAKR
ncbi:MAG: hypothetical protein K5639_02365 [Eubacterium sp.]|nr:hypothetical protein [Eubacterium sp.]